MGCATSKSADELPAKPTTGAGRPPSAQSQAEKPTPPVTTPLVPMAQTVPTATSVKQLEIEAKIREAEAKIREAEQRVRHTEAAIRLEEADIKACAAEQALRYAALEKALRDSMPGFFDSWANHDSTAALEVAIAKAEAVALPEGSSLSAALLAAKESLRSQREAKAKNEAEERARKEAVEREAEEKARREAAEKAQRDLDDKFRGAAHHNLFHVVEAEPWQSAIKNELHKSHGAHHHHESSGHDPAAFEAAAAAAAASKSLITKAHIGPKSKEERDAEASGFRTGVFVGTLVAGPIGTFVGGAMGAAHAKKQEQKAYDKGKHVRHEDTMKDKVIRGGRNIAALNSALL
jgi:hypothetical protein